jgi:hypothetical protein
MASEAPIFVLRDMMFFPIGTSDWHEFAPLSRSVLETSGAKALRVDLGQQANSRRLLTTSRFETSTGTKYFLLVF